MNEIEKENIRIMRSNGCSYGQIANTLGIKKCTVKKHCLRHDIKMPLGMVPQRTPREKWSVCPYCRKVFAVGLINEKRFCSDKCRSSCWKEERKRERKLRRAEEASLRELAEHQALKKELDFSYKKSDELIGDEEYPLGNNKEPTD